MEYQQVEDEIIHHQDINAITQRPPINVNVN
jgi:hypothetical protein